MSGTSPRPLWQCDPTCLACCLQCWMFCTQRPIVHIQRLQRRHSPAGAGRGKSLHAHIADLVVAEVQLLAARHRPAAALADGLDRLCEGLKPLVANLVAIEVEQLCIAHQTKRLGQESAHAKRQGQRTGQCGASSPATAPSPPYKKPRRELQTYRC